MKIYISLVLSLFIVAQVPLHAMLPPLTPQNNSTPLKLLMMHKPAISVNEKWHKPVHITLKGPIKKPSLTACLEPRNPKKNVNHCLDAECPFTFPEEAQWQVDTEYDAAVTALIEYHGIDKNEFNTLRAKLSRQYDKQFLAGKVSCVAGDQYVSPEILDVVKRCAHEMGCYDHILVRSGRPASYAPEVKTMYTQYFVWPNLEKRNGIASFITNLWESYKYRNQKEGNTIFLNLNQTGDMPPQELEYLIKHEIAHIKNKTGLLTVLLKHFNKQIIAKKQNDPFYAKVMQSDEKRADITALLTNIGLKSTAQKNFLRCLRAEKPDVRYCARVPQPNGTRIYYIEFQDDTYMTSDRIGFSIQHHPPLWERIAYIDDLGKAWDYWAQLSKIVSSSNRGQST